MARGLGCDHHDVEVPARDHLRVVNVEAVREREHGALLDVRLDVGLVRGRDAFVGHQHHDDVRAFDRFADFRDLEAGLLCLVPRRAALAQADGDLHAGIVEILRVRMTLRAVADDRHLLALDQRQVGVLFVVDLHLTAPVILNLLRPPLTPALFPLHREREDIFEVSRHAAPSPRAKRGEGRGRPPYTLSILSPRPIPDAPVRTVSRIAPGSIALRNASSFSPGPVSSIV